MLQAQGPLWHKKEREEGRIPPGLRHGDVDSRWAKSHYRGWVQGYGFHVGVPAPPYHPIVPFWAAWTFNHQNEAIRWVAQLGGFLPRKGDGDPGVVVLWRGLRRLHDLTVMWRLARPPGLVGNA